jgi:hypothetical protein
MEPYLTRPGALTNRDQIGSCFGYLVYKSTAAMEPGKMYSFI